MSLPKLHVKKDDEVKVIAGNDKGKTGKVLKAFPKDNRVVVEGVNIVHKHAQPSQDMPQGGIIEQEAPVDSSNVKLICKHCGASVKTGKKILDDGSKVRFCKECEEIID
ncbi:MAG: 50S ribosomal protein L24 [Bacillota bacterium]